MNVLLRRVCGFAVIGLAVSAIAAAPKQEGEYVREVEDQGYRIRLDISRQIIGIEIPEQREFGERGRVEAPIVATLKGLSQGFVSASILTQKAKQFDDGLYAAVELGAQNGAGRFRGKAAMLEALARTLAAGQPLDPESPAMIVLAACRLGTLPVKVTPALDAPLRAAVDSFLAAPARSKPIGFYTWSPALAAIFRQDRMLQSELTGRAGIGAIARALHADAEARATYDAYESLVTRLTNPLAGSGLRGVLNELDRGQISPPDRGLTFFPASRSHETDLVMKLYGSRPIPKGFSLVDEMIRRIRAGQLDLKPTAGSGWYDYQTWALEPLVNPEHTTEASHLAFRDGYRKQLLELFKGILALTRETHIKQLEVPPPGEAPAGDPKVIVSVAPELTVEPLATYYERRAQAYRFVRTALEEAFGVDGLRHMHRLMPDGQAALDLAAELEAIEMLFRGAHLTCWRELGVSSDAARAVGNQASADVSAFRKWAGDRVSDRDIARDARMMVPVFYDVGRKKTKVWVFLGWSERPVLMNFERPPTVAEVRKAGKPVKRDQLEVNFSEQWRGLAYPVSAEVYVTKILDREEFRRHCDKFKTRAAILENLE